MMRNAFLLTLYCGLIFYLSHQSTLPVPMAFPHQDKLVHGIAYAVMGLLAWYTFKYIQKPTAFIAIVSLVFCSFYGVTDEFHQSFIEGRDASVLDWLADTVGAGIAVTVLAWRKSYVGRC